MNKMSIRKDDTVVVLSGKDKGKQGKVLQVMPQEGKVIVEKVNMVSRHTKPRQQGQQGRRRLQPGEHGVPGAQEHHVPAAGGIGGLAQGQQDKPRPPPSPPRR